MKTYLCHKKVKAFKLHEIKGLRLCGQEPSEFADVSPVFIVNHNALIKKGCYIVIYEDSFISASPIDVFEKGYSVELEKPASKEEPEKHITHEEIKADLLGIEDPVEKSKYLLGLVDEEMLSILSILTDEEYLSLKESGVINEDHELVDLSDAY